MIDPNLLGVGPDGGLRCAWGVSTPDYVAYHDTEWGRPQREDTALFEKICLEGFQAGLSWITILRKRENFRSAFVGFDLESVAQFDETDVERLLADAGIIRHRGKIEATINNAARALELIETEGSLNEFLWSYQPAPSAPVLRSTSPESDQLSRDLKRRGWKFVGPTTAYSFMQAVGMVNDHHEGCVIRQTLA